MMNWPVLRNAVVFLGISALLSALMILGGFVFLDKMEDEYEAQEKRLNNARSQYRRLDEEPAIIDQYFPQFERFEGMGLIGEEQRLSWLEALHTAARHINLPELRYSVSSREPYAPDFPVDDGPYGVYASDMALSMGLLHEGDLFSLLAELDQHAVGTYSVVYCGLRAVGEEFTGIPAGNPRGANLHADCTLRWYTLKRAEEGDDKIASELR